MKNEILAVLRHYRHTPMSSEGIIARVRERGGSWKRSSIQRALGQLVTAGQVVNLCRDPETGIHRTSPCTYGLAS